MCLRGGESHLCKSSEVERKHSAHRTAGMGCSEAGRLETVGRRVAREVSKPRAWGVIPPGFVSKLETLDSEKEFKKGSQL